MNFAINDITDRFISLYDYLVSKGFVRNKSDLAKKIGMDASSLSKIFSKDRNITLSQLDNLSKLSNDIGEKLNINYFFSGNGEMIVSENNPTQNATPQVVNQSVPQDSNDLVSCSEEVMLLKERLKLKEEALAMKEDTIQDLKGIISHQRTLLSDSYKGKQNEDDSSFTESKQARSGT